MDHFLEVPHDLFGIAERIEDECSIRGIWYIPKNLIPDMSFPKPTGDNFDELQVHILLAVAREKEMQRSTNPFHAELEIFADKGEWRKAKRVFGGKRDLAIGHLCKSTSTMTLQVPTRAETLEGIQKGLIMAILEQVIQKPKATLRWDDNGIVACINFGNTYISTREHSA